MILKQVGSSLKQSEVFQRRIHKILLLLHILRLCQAIPFVLTCFFLTSTDNDGPSSLKHVILFLTTSVESMISSSLLKTHLRTKLQDCKGLLTYDN